MYKYIVSNIPELRLIYNLFNCILKSNSDTESYMYIIYIYAPGREPRLATL